MSVLSSLLAILSSALRVAGSLLSRPSRRRQAELDAHAARVASATGDADAVNARAERSRIQGMIPCAAVLALGMLAAGCGCRSVRSMFRNEDHSAAPKTVVVPADRWQYPMTNESGVAGWFVPLAVHAEMMEALVIVEAIRAKKEE